MGKVFRKGEVSQRHNIEFTMLEWYRLECDEYQLMDEIKIFVGTTLRISQTLTFSYQELFELFFSINPHKVSTQQLAPLMTEHTSLSPQGLTVDSMLEWLLSQSIAPQLSKTYPYTLIFITEFPQNQCELAQLGLNQKGTIISRRFEAMINGIEIANGYFELNHSTIQKQRMQNDIRTRQQLGLETLGLDETFIKAVDKLPSCSGVAVGVDRLLQIKTGSNNLHKLLSFTNLV